MRAPVAGFPITKAAFKLAYPDCPVITAGNYGLDMIEPCEAFVDTDGIFSIVMPILNNEYSWIQEWMLEMLKEYNLLENAQLECYGEEDDDDESDLNVTYWLVARFPDLKPATPGKEWATWSWFFCGKPPFNTKTVFNYRTCV